MAQTFGPYTPVVQAGDMFFISGQVGVNPQTKETDASVANQTAQALLNMTDLLEAEGLSRDDVVKTTIFLTDMADFAEVNEVYVRYFAEPRPARSTVGVQELPRVGGDVPIKVEIEAIAMKRAA